MQNAVYFPNLGIRFENVREAAELFGIKITYYGILTGIAVAAAVLITCLEAKRSRQNIEDYLELGIAGTILGVLGARVFYVLFSWEQYKEDLGGILRFREGGFAFYGALIGGIGAVFLIAKIKGLYPLVMLDTAAPGILIGQAVGRCGDFFSRESFGEYTDGLFAMRLPAAAVRASDVTEKMRNHVAQIDGVNFIQVHPVFLYEAAWCLFLAALIFVFRKYRQNDGEVFMLYLFGYGAGRFFAEGLRTDQLMLPGVQLPVSQILSVFIVIFSVLYFGYGRMEKGGRRRGGGYGTVGFGKIKKKKMFGR